MVDDDDDEQLVEVAQASSSLRHEESVSWSLCFGRPWAVSDHEQRKRPRVSLAAPNKQPHSRIRDESPATESNDDDDEDDEDDDAPSERPDSPPKTQYEISRDAGFKHLQYEDQDTQRATQKMRSRPVLIGDNHAADSGIIEAITCINFMCHERLTCELGPLINFIVGENGSGKSAVLTAITLCLGGKASATNRGGSLKDLIKQGRDHAILIVKIKNQGRDAYQHDLYGDSITVERHFSRTGGSGFKIKSATGRTISTKKQDVDDIVEYWCLQVDNPLNVLSQDNARQFLNQSSPANKYKFFVQGVQLEQLDNDYRLLQDYCDQNEERLIQHSATADRQKRELVEATRLAQVVQQNSELRARLRLYTNQMAWAQVVEQEDILEKMDQRIIETDGLIAEAEQKIEASSHAYEQADEKHEQLQESVNALAAEQGDHDKRVEAAEKAYHEAKRTLTTLHSEERDIRARLDAAHAEVVACESNIAAEEQRLADSNGDLPAQKREEHERAAQRESDLKRQQADHRASLPALTQKEEADKQELNKMEGLVTAKRQEVDAAELRIRRLQQSGDGVPGFDDKMKQLMSIIASDRGFDQKPVGPLGAHIQLLKPAWGAVIERVVGNGLQGFIVTSKKDQLRLSAMMNRVGIKQSPVFIGGRRELDLQGKEPAPELDTILRVLKFDDNLIRDHLIINNFIEQTVLVEDRHDAEKIIIDREQSRNVTACICRHDKKRGAFLRLTQRNEVISSSFIQPFQGAPRMKSDRDSQLAIQVEAKNQLGEDLADLDRRRRQLQQSHKKSCADRIAHKKEADQLERQIRQAGAEIQRLNEDLDAFDGAGGRLEMLRQDLQEAKAKEEHEGNQWATMKAAKPGQSSTVDGLKKKLLEEKESKKDFESRVAKAERKVVQARDIRQVALAQKNRAIEGRDLKRIEKDRLEEQRDQQEAKVAHFSSEAAKCAPERVHIAEGETYQSIESKFVKLKAQLEKRREQIGFDDRDIFERKANAQTAYARTLDEVRQMKRTQDTLKDTIVMRMERWRKFQRFISARARASFLYLLSERGFRGQLKIDHRNKKLDLKVEPDDTKSSAAGRSTKTLSGGEKSFSSICLLLSIWEAMGSPLRCLDEFDVFMDNVNRTVSTNMLITAARRSVSRQYILITPNAIEGRASLDKDVKIIRYGYSPWVLPTENQGQVC